MKRLAAQLAQKKTEEKKVGEGASSGRVRKVIKPDSLTVKEILIELSVKGPRTLEALAKAVNVDKDLLKKYINYLAKSKQVKLGKNTRGATVIRLPGQAKRNPSWLSEREDSYHESLGKKIGRLCWSDLSSEEISDHLNVPEGFVSEICDSRRRSIPRHNPLLGHRWRDCECQAEWDEPHFSWCPVDQYYRQQV